MNAAEMKLEIARIVNEVADLSQDADSIAGSVGRALYDAGYRIIERGEECIDAYDIWNIEGAFDALFEEKHSNLGDAYADRLDFDDSEDLPYFVKL